MSKTTRDFSNDEIQYGVWLVKKVLSGDEVDSNHKLSTKVPWSDFENSKPLEDLQEAKEIISRSGYYAGIMLASDNTIKNLLVNENVQKRFIQDEKPKGIIQLSILQSGATHYGCLMGLHIFSHGKKSLDDKVFVGSLGKGVYDVSCPKDVSAWVILEVQEERYAKRGQNNVEAENDLTAMAMQIILSGERKKALRDLKLFLDDCAEAGFEKSEIEKTRDTILLVLAEADKIIDFGIMRNESEEDGKGGE